MQFWILFVVFDDENTFNRALFWTNIDWNNPIRLIQREKAFQHLLTIRQSTFSIVVKYCKSSWPLLIEQNVLDTYAWKQ